MLSRKIMLYLSTLALISTGANAAGLSVFGKANVSLQASDEGEGSFTEMKSNSSRFGIKGSVPLDNDIEVLYSFEWQVDLADLSGSDNLKSRNQYIGLKTHFGTVLLGRNDTVLKKSQGKIDQFSDYEADLKGLWTGENRMSDSVTYYSPKIAGLTLGLSYIVEDELEGDDAQSVSLNYGDAKLKNSKWFGAIAADFDMKGYDNQRISIQGKFDAFKLGAILHHQEAVVTGDSKTGVVVSGAHTLGNLLLKVQYQTLEDDSSVTIGSDYKLGKTTKIYIWYTKRSLDNSEDKSWLALGLEHKF
jgi:predicted porin